MTLQSIPRYSKTMTVDEGKAFLHATFNQRHHSDSRSEKHTYINRQCLINALEAENTHLNEQKIELTAIPSSDRTDLQASALDRIDKRMKQLTSDIAELETAREEHLPHYAFVMLAYAFVESAPFQPNDNGEGQNIWNANAVMSGLAERLALLLIADESVSDKYAALDNMITNLKSDADRPHDSLDRLVSTDNRTMYWQQRNPQALYDVLIQDPPQTGSAAIRGETPAEAPDEGATE